MKLRNKVLLIVGISLGSLIAFILLGSRLILDASFTHLEREQAQINLQRVELEFNEKLSHLKKVTSDYAIGDDIDRFMQDKNAIYMRDNVNSSNFENENLNFMLFYDQRGTLVFGKAYDLVLRQDITIPSELLRYIRDNKAIFYMSNTKKKVSGYIKFMDGIALLAASPIINNQGGVIRGTLVMGRFIDKNFLTEISAEVALNLEVYPIQKIQGNLFLQTLFKKLLKSPVYTQLRDNKFMVSSSLIRDLTGKPAAIISVKRPRAIYWRGRSMINDYLLIVCGLGLAITFILYWLLQSVLIRRLELLNQQIKGINVDRDLSKRVATGKTDEVTSVANQVNTMLDLIEDNHKQLESRVTQLNTINVQLRQEISDKEEARRELNIYKENLEYLAHYDELTGLPNRFLFEDLLSAALSKARRHHSMLAVLFLDFDRFKYINDAFGHDVGDEVLRIGGRFIKEILRAEDVVARLSGDEFIILLEDINNIERTSLVAEKLLQKFMQPIMAKGREFYLNISVGISIFPNDGDNFNELRRKADLAMYQAKQNGGRNFHYYTEELDQEAHRVVELEAELRQAIIKQEFRIYYQPKFEVATREVIGVEALLRWQHPTRGLLESKKFLHVAEMTGIINDLNAYVLATACKACYLWQNYGYAMLPISINLSNASFYSLDLIPLINSTLNDIGLSGKYLELEVTESIITENAGTTIARLDAIRDLEVKIVLGSFGVGNSSLVNLKDFPIDTIKIDQLLTKDIPFNKTNLAIVQAIIILAHGLHLQVIAEGIENLKQLECLLKEGCNMAQGYYFSSPLTELDMLAFLQQSKKTLTKTNSITGS